MVTLRASTPTLDALAHRGVRFETAVAHVPLTGPSHASILTGHTPLGHGYHNNGGFVLPPSVKTAAGEFRQAGYRTAAFVSGTPSTGVSVSIAASTCTTIICRAGTTLAGRPTSSVSGTPRRTSR